MEDLIIIGAGPAGLTAGLYSARARLNAILFEKLLPGGQILSTDSIENYPGFPDGLSGFELVDRMKRQAEKFGLIIQSREVTGLEFHPEKKIVFTSDETLETRALIITSGAAPRKLGVNGEEKLTGKGVSYCATCDGPFYRDQEVAVVGGGDTAVEEALFLTRFASKVYIIHRRDELRATKLLQERALAEEKIVPVWDSVATQVVGETGVEGIDIQNVKTNEKSHLPVQGIFVFIGFYANNQLVKDLLELDRAGFIITNNEMETSVPGVFAAGDIRAKLLRQVSTAVGDGATAAFAAEKYLNSI